MASAAANPFTEAIADYYPGQGFYLAAPNGNISTLAEFHGHVAYFGLLIGEYGNAGALQAGRNRV